MTESENIYLQSLKMSLDTLTIEITKQRQEAAVRGQYEALPEWITLEQAVALKRGASLTFFRQKKFLQPCCGLHTKMVAGRRCWKKADVIVWLAITDESLKAYAESYSVSLPANYAERGV